jgi:preprotein translocase subunit SecG
METIFYIIHVLVCIAMLPIILLQSGKGGGVSATFGGGGSGTVFGSRGASAFLTKMTSGAAIIFMITSMTLSWYASKSRSVVGDEPEQSVPATGTVEAGDDQVARPGTGTAAAGTETATQ